MSKRNRWQGASKYVKYGIQMLGDMSDVSLPSGWIGVYHVSGGVVYLHRETRVVTWSMPYVIPKGTSIRKHNIPITAVPCLQQKRSLGQLGKESCVNSCKEDGEEMCLNGDLNSNSAGKNVCDNGEPSAKIMRLQLNDDATDKCKDVNYGKECVEKFGTIVGGVNGGGGDAEGSLVELQNGFGSCPYGFENISGKRDKPLPMVVETADACNGLSEETNDTSLVSNESPAETTNFIDEPLTETNSPEDQSEPTDLISSPATSLTNGHSSISVNESKDCTTPTEEFFRDFEEVVNPYEVAPASLHNYLSSIYEFTELKPEHLTEPVFICTDYQDENDECKKLSIVGKTPFQILNEYCQRELKSVPIVKQVQRHSQHDFTVEVVIKNIKFGIANGDTMRGAKHSVASITLNIFDHTLLNTQEPPAYLTVFDQIPLQDKSVVPTIEEFLPLDLKYPHETMLIFLTRNFEDFTEACIEYEAVDTSSSSHNGEKHQEFTMKYNNYKVSGISENPKQTKELAAQALLAAVYPQLKTWGSVIRLTENYMEVTQEQSSKNGMKPNKCIMHVLRKEMQKIAKSRLVE